MLRTKQFGSSLHNISKKRQAEMASGVWKPKPRKPLRKASKKAASDWNKARKECLDTYGNKCFICGRSDLPIHVHHFLFTRTQRPDLKYDQSNLIPLCSICHSHSGADKRFYELKEIIIKIKGQ